ncbi:MAG: hypothetical protein V4451_01640 [Pseudomonadota bacterium]
MADDEPVWVGADPGGKLNFGVAILRHTGVVESKCLDSADEAIAYVLKNVARCPAGVGVDAPLWWSSGISGDRHADQWLRRRYGLSGGEVQAANSLRGAALTQGAMFVHRLRSIYPSVPITETHPKAILKAIFNDDWLVFTSKFQIDTPPVNEHCRDALIGAVAARESSQGRWTHDLALTRLPSEQDPLSYWLAPVHYYWPEP